MPGPPRVALATCALFPQLHDDDRLLLPALAALGVHAEPALWDDPAVRWHDYDLVVLRDTWDYTDRLEEFLAWARAVPRLLNPVDVVAWSTDKRYLRDLAEAGVPVVPTTWLEPGDDVTPPAFEHVVKPVVSAGARDTGRYEPGHDSRPHVRRLLDAGRPVMVQPYLRGIDEAGETAVVHLGGRFSHAARKAPVLVTVGAEAPLDAPDAVEITAREPSAAELDVARAALAAVPFDASLLYARVDLVPGPDGAPVVIELELVEPSLFLSTAPGAADRLAEAVVEAIRPAAR